MNVKLDENLARAHVSLVSQHGHVVDRVHDQGLSGASDETVWKTICAEDRFLITLDLDFADVRRFVPGSHPGLLLLRPNRSSVAGVSSILRRVLGEGPLESLSGCLAVADEFHTRIRRPAPKFP